MIVSAFLENIRTGAQAQHMPLQEALCRMREAGLDTVYVGRDSIEELGEALFSMLESLNLPVEGLHGWFDFGGDPEGEGWKWFLDAASRCGAKHVLFVPGLLDSKDTHEKKIRMENMISALRRAVTYGRGMGIAVTMENLDQITAPYNSVSGLSWFLSQVDGLQCCFDTGNFVIYHEDELQALDRFLNRLCTVHVKDRSMTRLHPQDGCCLCADGAKVYPAPVGDGYMQIPEIISRLKDSGYEGALIAELYGYDPDHMLDGMLKSVSWLRAHI